MKTIYKDIAQAAFSTFNELESFKINRQKKELDKLIESVKYETFFFIVDERKQAFKLLGGIQELLGYSEQEFNLSFYLSIIHEHHFVSSFLLNKAFFNIVNSDTTNNFKFSEERYVIDIALKHSNGYYLLFKRSISCWDSDAHKNSIKEKTYLNEFTIWGEYNPEKISGIRPRIINKSGFRLKPIEEVLRLAASQVLEEEKTFSVQELRILRKYAYLDDVNTKQIADSFKISHNTVNNHNRNIIEKFSRIYPGENIGSAKSVAVFLRKENFL